MRKSSWITFTLALALACLGAGIARADQVTLDVSGTLSPINSLVSCSGLGCTLGGTLVIDNTAGTVVSIDVTFSGESPLVGPFTLFGGTQTTPSGNKVILATDAGANELALVFPTATVGSLVGYDGGALFGTTSIMDVAKSSEWLLSSGSLTPVATPEPSSLALIFAGIGFLPMMRKRWAARGY